MDIAIVGNGIAGVSAAEAARRASPEARITLVGAEPTPPYYRMNLTRYLAGELDRNSLQLHSEAWYEQNRIDLKLGMKATAVLAGERMIELGDHSQLRYDTLVLATGALPCPPSFEGAGLDGVLTFRTLSDADEILRRAESRPSCACIGAGTLGLEIAGALSRRGLKVTLIDNHECLMHRQLSPGASAVLERHLTRIGIGLEKAAKTSAILGHGSASGVALSDGRIVAAELVAVATGALPEIELAKRAGIKVDRGILVDDHLRTSDSSVFAAGDAAEFNGIIHGTWAPAKLQGGIAGANAAGAEKRFAPSPRLNSLKVLGINIFSLGQVQPRRNGDTVLAREENEGFQQFLFSNGRMAGCILIGDARCASAARKAVETGTDFSDVLSRGASAEDICGILLS